MDFFRELRSLTDALAAAGVDYALRGGVALGIHGFPELRRTSTARLQTMGV